MPDLTHLDAGTLQAFLDHDVAGFSEELRKIRRDNESAPALKSMLDGITTTESLQQNPFLAIGLMATSEVVGGSGLVTTVTDQAKSIDDVLEFQQQLFNDFDSNMQETIDTLLKTQGSSLEAIEGQQLLDAFGEVEDTLSNAGDTGSD
ncbi:type VII secretion system-associated protein [Streptomyces luteolifulvus]|jgi:hypothetical protein|uniref:Type VII secretion system-associated protein n=1 Tax=Streptomyces luteolifulvus TaxID=2615112 RepID=A0A6H9USD6_9ACTN|nr:type VII secretion system-associated protein [Streptomyces luteolifulvus]KAB1140859.1 type VII secretion system-associated protein [Streptomyces luteolifulvus]